MTGLPKIRPKPWDTIIPVKSSSGVQAGNAQNDSWGGSGFASESDTSRDAYDSDTEMKDPAVDSDPSLPTFNNISPSPADSTLSDTSSNNNDSTIVHGYQISKSQPSMKGKAKMSSRAEKAMTRDARQNKNNNTYIDIMKVKKPKRLSLSSGESDSEFSASGGVANAHAGPSKSDKKKRKISTSDSLGTTIDDKIILDSKEQDLFDDDEDDDEDSDDEEVHDEKTMDEEIDEVEEEEEEETLREICGELEGESGLNHIDIKETPTTKPGKEHLTQFQLFKCFKSSLKKVVGEDIAEKGLHRIKMQAGALEGEELANKIAEVEDARRQFRDGFNDLDTPAQIQALAAIDPKLIDTDGRRVHGIDPDDGVSPATKLVANWATIESFQSSNYNGGIMSGNSQTENVFRSNGFGSNKVGVKDSVPSYHLVSKTGKAPYLTELNQEQLKLTFDHFSFELGTGLVLGKIVLATSNDVMDNFIFPFMESESWNVIPGAVELPLEFDDGTNTEIDLVYYVISKSGGDPSHFSLIIPAKAGSAIASFGCDLAAGVLEDYRYELVAALSPLDDDGESIIKRERSDFFSAMAGGANAPGPRGITRIKGIAILACQERLKMEKLNVDLINPATAIYLKNLASKYGTLLDNLDTSGIPKVLEGSLLQLVTTYWTVKSAETKRFYRGLEERVEAGENLTAQEQLLLDRRNANNETVQEYKDSLKYKHIAEGTYEAYLAVRKEMAKLRMAWLALHHPSRYNEVIANYKRREARKLLKVRTACGALLSRKAFKRHCRIMHGGQVEAFKFITGAEKIQIEAELAAKKAKWEGMSVGERAEAVRVKKARKNARNILCNICTDVMVRGSLHRHQGRTHPGQRKDWKWLTEEEARIRKDEILANTRTPEEQVKFNQAQTALDKKRKVRCLSCLSPLAKGSFSFHKKNSHAGVAAYEYITDEEHGKLVKQNKMDKKKQNSTS